MPLDTLKALLKKDGSSLTRPRLQIFKLLLNQEPQSMQVLIRRAGNQIDRASIYRTIELFERLGIVHRLNVGWKYKIELSDAFLDHHHHMHCTNCGASFKLEAGPMLETMINTLTKKANFSARSHQLEIYGLCQSCQKN